MSLFNEISSVTLFNGETIEYTIKGHGTRGSFTYYVCEDTIRDFCQDHDIQWWEDIHLDDFDEDDLMENLEYRGLRLMDLDTGKILNEDYLDLTDELRLKELLDAFFSGTFVYLNKKS